MGGSQSLLTISSPCPAKDASYLRQIFANIGVETTPGGNDDENQQQQQVPNGCKILHFPADNITLFLVPSKEPTKTGWVLNNATIFDNLSKVQRQLSQSQSQSFSPEGTTTITLPSQSVLIVCTASVVESSQGRQDLAQWLSTSVETEAIDVQDAASASSTASPSPSITNNSISVSSQNGGKRNKAVFKLSSPKSPSSPNKSRKTTKPPPIIIPTIRAQLLQQNGKYQTNVPLNSQQPIPFETDLFQGKALVIMRPNVKNDDAKLIEQVDPYYSERIFSKKSRRIIIQFQGKFKRKPQGIVYAGAELSDPMQLGLVTRGVASILLSFVEKFSSTVHYSYGDAKTKTNTTTTNGETTDNNNDDNDDRDIERSHIVVPAYTCFENLIVTKPGDTPPELGALQWDGEDKVQERERKSGKLGYGDWNTTDTYSFCYFSMYIDLPTWSLVKLPIPSGSIGLETFWGRSTLSICMYEKLEEPINSNSDSVTAVVDSNKSKKPKKKKAKETNKHIGSLKEYAFSLKLDYLNFDGSMDNQIFDDQQVEDGESNAMTNGKTDAILRWSGNRPTPLLRHSSALMVAEEDESLTNYDDASISTAKQSMTRSESTIFRLASDDDPDVDEYYFDAGESLQEIDYFVGQQLEEVYAIDRMSVDTGDGDTSRSLQTLTSDELLCCIDNVVPFFIEVCSTRTVGYGKAYAIVVEEQMVIRSDSRVKDLIGDNRGIRVMLERMFSPRLSSSERTRRALGIALLSAERNQEKGGLVSKKKLDDFLEQMPPDKDMDFLKRSSAVTSIILPENDILQTCAFAARAISDRHWIEEWVAVTDRRISFFHPEKRRPHFNVPFSTIMDIFALDTEDCPVPMRAMVSGSHIGQWFSYLAIQTVGRTVYLMFRSETDRNDLLSTITNHLTDNQFASKMENAPSQESCFSSLAAMDNPADEFLHKSSMWHCKNRRVLNCGLFSLHNRSATTSDPSEIVEQTLLKAMLVQDVESTQDFKRRHEFLVSAALLKNASVARLSSEASKMAFFLNLYHVMILHAYMVIGAPDRSLQWISYFNNIAYQVGDDIFSLTELEHCIIRSEMSFPSQFLSRFVIPKSRYNQMALKTKDYRLNFALNCGSKSNPSSIFLYKEKDLQDQLDNAARLHLKYSAVVQQQTKGNDLVLILPRICQWFLDDFGGTDESLLKLIEKHVPSGLRKLLSARWTPEERRFDMKGVTIKYHNFQYDCRPLILASTK